jgi:hypothetical protein
MTGPRPRAWNSTLPAGPGPKRTPFAVPLNEDGSPRWSALGRNAELGRGSALRSARLVLAEGPGAGAVKGKSAARRSAPIPRESRKRAHANRERSAMADRRWPDRREGTVMCGCGRPDCNRPAMDLHELLSRARGGSITDEANCIPLSRICHDEVTFRPESELGWAYSAGILRHSWDAEGNAS